MNFQPTMSVEQWRARQNLLLRVRRFFMDREVLEVETPILSQASALDPAIDVFASEFFIDGMDGVRSPRYLSTSPEFHMKRLLAAGYPDVFQIAKAFRNGEEGALHNSEFSILEWYRVGWTAEQLQAEVLDLVRELMPDRLPESGKAEVKTYKEVLRDYAGLADWKVSLQECRRAAAGLGLVDIESDSPAEWVDYILSAGITPLLGKDKPLFLVEWPAEQAALAQIFQDSDGDSVAARFELYIDGVELCNGYQELVDAAEQKERFLQDQEERRQLNKRVLKQDDLFLAALESGMPECAGVAVGLDRLFMLALGGDSLDDVLLFPGKRA
jgi:lysyl-tRNA synthetase class 2